MFEVGFSEMLLIMALALIVLGPEKLPKLAAQVGRWLGRARNMARQFREQLEEEAILEETRPKRAATPATGAAATTAAAAVSTATAEPTPAAPADLNPSAADDPDTRHNDYAGAAWEPPTESTPVAPTPVAPATDIAATEDATRVGRGA
jgi:sec-independent protein translocase protein TatB